jgi:hypothetical protein
MKKAFLLLIAVTLVSAYSLRAQNIEQPPVTKHSADQSQLYNEVFFNYGIGSLFIFTGTINHDYPTYSDYYYNYDETDVTTAGSFSIGYNRMLNKVVSIGFIGGYQRLSYTKEYNGYSYYPNDSAYHFTAQCTDNILSGMAKITFNYVNKPMIRVYSGIGMGIGVDLSSELGDRPTDTKQNEKKIVPAGQLTFMGVRFGRQFGGFCEFGIGTNAIVSAGLSYQFGD